MGELPKKIHRRKFIYGGFVAAVGILGGISVYLATKPTEVKIVEKLVEKTAVKTITELKTATQTEEETIVQTVTQTQTVEKVVTQTVGTTLQGQAPRKLEQSYESWLDRFAENIASGGPPKDGIPPIDRPRFVGVDEAEKFLNSNDVVFGIDYNGVTRAYPQMILVWHEIVNDLIEGEKLSITYCPLTGSAIGYKGKSKRDGSVRTFGTTGKLVNSNLLMYDRQTDSNWPQILGIAINGPDKGNVVDEFPVVFTRWELWKKRYPDTQVLSSETGFFRAYGNDPYGSYTEKLGYYFDESVWFPVMENDTRFHPKKVFIGVKLDSDYLAIPKEELTKASIAGGSVGGENIVALYDKSLETSRVFLSKIGDKLLSFKIDGMVITDRETGSQWNSLGKAVRGPLEGKQLPPVNSWDVFWFAWAAFYPKTKVLPIN